MLSRGEGRLVFSGEGCIFKAVFLLQSGKFPNVFFTLQVLETFLTSSPCVKWQAQWKSFGRQGQMAEK